MATIPSFVPARLRRSVILFLVMVATGLGLFLIIFPSPDLSQEIELHRKIAELSVRVENAEQVNVNRKHELQELYRQFSELVKVILLEKKTDRVDLEEAVIKDGGAKRLSYEAAALLKDVNWTYDLSLPGIHQFLPHTVNFPSSLVPAFKLASKPRSEVSIILGIPTVKREHQSYLSVTLKSVFESLTAEESADCLVIVFVAETDLEFVKLVAAEISQQFPEQVESGLVEVVSPPPEYYPDMSLLRKTLGDEPERVQWRSKQNLDYAFLMMYAQGRGVFYVQLEDDILTKPGFTTTMKEFALEKTLNKEPWFVIDYCQLGFIGKLFRTSNLPKLIQFFLMFFNDKPGDWLLEDVLHTMVCKLDHDMKQCKKEKSLLWVHYKPSLFQHIGTHSSLKGKVQKLKDKQFGKISMFVAHVNPPAKIETVIKNYKGYSLSRAYQGETFYWGLVPQAGDTITFSLEPPVPLHGFKFVSGNAEHPSDRFVDTDVEILLAAEGNAKVNESYPRTDDGYAIVGHFDSNGLAEGALDPEWGPIQVLRISVHATSENWVILSEMHLKTTEKRK